MTTDTATGLRERKKAQTTAALVDAAYALVAQRGLAAVTADAVAERAGVSRRTFFNYFPSIEAALVRGIRDFLTDLGERIEERPMDEPIMDALEDMIALPADRHFLERILQLAAVGTAEPQAKDVLHSALMDWMTWFIAHLQERLPDADELYAVHLATAIVAAAQAAIIVWAERTDRGLGRESVEEFSDLLCRSMQQVRFGFDHIPSA